jgi:hypothetical protein
VDVKTMSGLQGTLGFDEYEILSCFVHWRNDVYEYTWPFATMQIARNFRL